MLRIKSVDRVLTVALTPTPIGGSGIHSRRKQMLNLVEKYTEETAAQNEDGVVAIEYVLVAGVVVLGIAAVATTSLWNDMKAKLDAIF